MEDDITEFITKSPGKILLCGGYLILNPKNSGLVVDIDTYFTCKSIIKFAKFGHLYKTLKVKIKSVNFNLEYLYEINLTQNHNEIYLEIKNDTENDNEFILFSVLFAFYLVINEYIEVITLNQSIGEMNIMLEGDEYFYSFENGLRNNKKTGLGSSSALIVSIVSNIFLVFKSNFEKILSKTSGKISNILKEDQMVKVLLFSLIANNYAQKKVNVILKKIGSGFDIQSCLIGSHIFNRCNFIGEFFDFFPSNIDKLRINNQSKRFIDDFSKRFLENYFKNINYIETPNHISIHLISLFEGSNTRILASKVLDWAKKNQKCTNTLN